MTYPNQNRYVEPVDQQEIYINNLYGYKIVYTFIVMRKFEDYLGSLGYINKFASAMHSLAYTSFVIF